MNDIAGNQGELPQELVLTGDYAETTASGEEAHAPVRTPFASLGLECSEVGAQINMVGSQSKVSWIVVR